MCTQVQRLLLPQAAILALLAGSSLSLPLLLCFEVEAVGIGAADGIESEQGNKALDSQETSLRGSSSRIAKIPR